MEYWHWLALGIVLVALEVHVPAAVFGFWGVAAIVVGVMLVVAPDVGLHNQVTLFVVLWMLATGLWSRQLNRWAEHTRLNRRGRRHVGRHIRLARPLEGSGRGRMSIDDTVWRAVSEDGGDLPAGQEVRITGVSDGILRVRAAVSWRDAHPGEGAAPPAGS